jgi:hypothetical protein
MSSRKRKVSAGFRMGKVLVYLHHGAWWLYYRDGGQPLRRKVAQTRPEAEQVAAQVNAQLTSGAPSLLSFNSFSVPELRQQFLDYHEHALKSSVGTVRRYRAATQPLKRIDSRAGAFECGALSPDGRLLATEGAEAVGPGERPRGDRLPRAPQHGRGPGVLPGRAAAALGEPRRHRAPLAAARAGGGALN